MKFLRCRWDRKIAGIFGGLGQVFQIDPTILRIFGVILAILTAILPFIIIYLILWAIIPNGPPGYVQIPGKKLKRSTIDRKISGVCGGIGEYFGFNPSILRLIFIVLFFLTGFVPLLLSYLLLCWIIPERV